MTTNHAPLEVFLVRVGHWEVRLKARNGEEKAIDRALAIIDRQNEILGVTKAALAETNVIVPIQIVEVNRLPSAAPFLEQVNNEP